MPDQLGSQQAVGARVNPSDPACIWCVYHATLNELDASSKCKCLIARPYGNLVSCQKSWALVTFVPSCFANYKPVSWKSTDREQSMTAHPTYKKMSACQAVHSVGEFTHVRRQRHPRVHRVLLRHVGHKHHSRILLDRGHVNLLHIGEEGSKIRERGETNEKKKMFSFNSYESDDDGGDQPGVKAGSSKTTPQRSQLAKILDRAILTQKTAEGEVHAPDPRRSASANSETRLKKNHRPTYKWSTNRYRRSCRKYM